MIVAKDVKPVAIKANAGSGGGGEGCGEIELGIGAKEDACWVN